MDFSCKIEFFSMICLVKGQFGNKKGRMNIAIPAF